MFLKVMNDDEKGKFLELVYKVANIDGEYAEDEEELIRSYKNELGVKTIKDTATLEELIEYFARKNNEIKKVVFFETIGLINADEKIEKEEKEVIVLMQIKFELNEDTYRKLYDVAKKLQSVYDEIFDVIFD